MDKNTYFTGLWGRLYGLVLAKHLTHWHRGNSSDYFYILSFDPINLLTVSPSPHRRKNNPP